MKGCTGERATSTSYECSGQGPKTRHYYLRKHLVLVTASLGNALALVGGQETEHFMSRRSCAALAEQGRLDECEHRDDGLFTERPGELGYGLWLIRGSSGRVLGSVICDQGMEWHTMGRADYARNT